MRIILRFLRQPGLHWIFVDVPHMGIEIVLVSYLMLGKTRMPYRETRPWLLSDFARRAALDELHSFLKRCCFARSQDEMQMIRHHDMTMDEVISLIAIMKNRPLYNRGRRRVSKQPSPLPSVGRDEVRCPRLRTMFWSSHLASGAKAPLQLFLYGGAEGPPFRVASRTIQPSSLISCPRGFFHQRNKIVE